VFSPVISRTRSRTATLPNYMMIGGWHDDVVYMMRHEHDDNAAPGHSSVTRKFSNYTSLIIYRYYLRFMSLFFPNDLFSQLLPYNLPISTELFPYYVPIIFSIISLLCPNCFPTMSLLFPYVSYYFFDISLFFPYSFTIFPWYVLYDPFTSLIYLYYFPIISVLFSYYDPIICLFPYNDFLRFMSLLCP
jgi:hypothetical protein